MWFVALLAQAPVVLSLAHRAPTAPIDWTLGVDGALHLSVENVFHAVNIDGSLKWTFDALSPILTHKEGSNGTIHILAQSPLWPDYNRTYFAIDGRDGSIQWQLASAVTGRYLAEDTKLLISNSTLYYVCGDPAEYIEAIDVNGTWKWVDSVHGATQVDVGPDGGVLVQTFEETQSGVYIPFLSALHPEDGTSAWMTKMDSPELSNGWTFSKGEIFVVSAMPGDKVEANLVHLHGEDGSIIWNASYEVMVREDSHGPTVTDVTPISGCNGEVYVPNLKSEDGICSIRAFDFNGNTLRTLPCSTSSFCHFQHLTRQNENDTAEDIFLTRGCDGTDNFVAYSGTTGQLLWNASIAGHFSETEFDFGPDGTIFALDSASEVVAIRDGYDAWRISMHGYEAALMAKDGTTYLMQSNGMFRSQPEVWGEVVAVDTDGVQKWRYQIMDPAVGSASTALSALAVV